MMYGQMTAGSWIYIGTQGILQGTYETFAACARDSTSAATLAGRLVLTAGLGGMGGAQPLAVTMNGRVCLVVEVDPRAHRAAARRRGYLRPESRRPRRGARRALEAPAPKARPLSIGLSATRPTCFPSCVRRGVVPDVVTDQTSAHDPLNGYVPARA